MIISSISVRNFKTLNMNNFQFSHYNIIIGPNGAGKSNLVSFFKFIADILNDDLDSAIARQGTISSILNFNNKEKLMTIEINFKRKYNKYEEIKESLPSKIKYNLELEFKNETIIFVREDIVCEYLYMTLDELDSEAYNSAIIESMRNRFDKPISDKYEKITENEFSFEIYNINIQRNNDHLNIQSNYPDLGNKNYDNVNSFIDLLKNLFDRKIYKKSNLIITEYHKSIIDNISIIRNYDFDTKEPKKPRSQKGEKYLVTNGENLVTRLNSLFMNENKKKEFLRMYKSFLPYIKDAEIRKTTSNSQALYISEIYNRKFTPPELVSDGTIGVIAILMALYYEESNIVIIEEPEKYIHPEIVRKIAHSIDDVSIYRQIIVTTHNTELLKHSKKDNIIFVSRSKEGYSVFSYPSTDDKVREFLKNDLGLEDLFVHNLMGVM